MSFVASKMWTGSIRRVCGGALEDIVSLAPIGEPRRKITVASLREKKLQHEPITCLTAYDYSSARLVDEAGIDIVLVGDSLAQTMLGLREHAFGHARRNAAPHQGRASRREARAAHGRHAFRVVSRQTPSDAVRNAARFVKEARRGGGKDRRRREACRTDPPHDRCRDSGGRTHRTDAAIGQCDGRLQGAGQRR